MNHVSFDVNELAKSLRVEMENLHPFSDECSIYRVPQKLREVNEKAYTPQVVSLGPFHHGKEEFKAMEEHKTLYLQVFLQRTKVSLENLIIFIKQNETKLRNCYAETIKLSSMDFVRMILQDSVFVISFLLACNYCGDFLPKKDRIFGKPGMINYIRYDMCLLENQLPLFILEDLLKLSNIVAHHEEDLSMIKLIYMFLKSEQPLWVSDGVLEKFSSCKVEHFVDFLRICQKPKEQKKVHPNKRTILTTPSATELRQAGIKFKPISINGESWKILDIKFDIDKGMVEIPVLILYDTSEIMARNLQAFEQCHCPHDSYFNDCISMINMLIHSTKDVELLIQKGIIENRIQDNDSVLIFFHNLSKGILVNSDNFYFSSLVEDLNKYCRKRSHKWKANLKQNYFHNPWAIFSILAAGFLLIIAVIQAVCSIIEVLD